MPTHHCRHVTRVVLPISAALSKCACVETCTCVADIKDDSVDGLARWEAWKRSVADEASAWMAGHPAFGPLKHSSHDVDEAFGRVVVCPKRLFYPIPNTAALAPPPLASAKFDVALWCERMQRSIGCNCAMCAGHGLCGQIDPGRAEPGDAATAGGAGRAAPPRSCSSAPLCDSRRMALQLVQEALGRAVCAYVFPSARLAVASSDAGAGAVLVGCDSSVSPERRPRGSEAAQLRHTMSLAVHYWARSWQKAYT